MAITLATGTTVSIAKTYGTAVAMSVITNATSAVATLAAAHGVTVGDYVEVTSGWDLLDKRVVRVSAVSTNDVTLEGVDTTSTANYPAGAGIGSVRRITAWSQLTQLKDLSTEGGTQNFADITSLSDRTEKQMPTTRSVMSMTLTTYDDPNLSWYADVSKASDETKPYGLLMGFPNGSKLVANSYWSVKKVPGVTKNEALTSEITLSYAADPIRYSA